MAWLKTVLLIKTETRDLMVEREPTYKQFIETGQEDSVGMVKDKDLAENMAYAERAIVEAPLPDKPRPIQRIERNASEEVLSIILGILRGPDRAASKRYWEEVDRFRKEQAEYEKAVSEIENGKEDRANEAAEKLLKHEIFQRAYDTYLRELYRETELDPATAKHRAEEAAQEEVKKYVAYQDQLAATRQAIETAEQG